MNKVKPFSHITVLVICACLFAVSLAALGWLIWPVVVPTPVDDYTHHSTGPGWVLLHLGPFPAALGVASAIGILRTALKIRKEKRNASIQQPI